MLKVNTSTYARSISLFLAMLLVLISSSAQALIQRSFINLGFESVQISNTAPCRVYASQGSSVPGWSTTHPTYSGTGRISCAGTVNAGVDVTSSAPIFEVWKGARELSGGTTACTSNTQDCISGRSGTQFIELNAEAISEVRQQVCLENGETVGWKFSHNGRNASADQMRFKAGTQSIIQVATTTTGGGSVSSCDSGTCSAVQSARTTVTGKTRWADYSGTFTANNSVNTFIGFESLNGTSTSGNFLDDIQVTLKPAVEFKLGNYTDVENINASQSVEIQVVGIVPNAISLNFSIDPTSTAVLGTDYTINGGTSNSFNVSLPAGDYSNGTIVTIPVALLNNSVVEGSRFFKVILTPDATKFTIMPTSSCTNTGGNATSTYSIQDDDIGLQLEKTWVNAAVNDKATLITTGGASGAANISYVSNASATNVSNTSSTIILAAGVSRTLLETLDGSNAGAYNASAWSCNGGSLSGSVLTTSAADYGKVIKCTVSNTRTTSLRLAKVWGANSLATDSATIPATTGGTNNTTAFTTPGGTNANSGAPVIIAVGNTITFLAETGTNIANYNTVLSCTANGGATANALSGTNGQVNNTLVIGAGDASKSIVCSYTNTRKSTTFRLAKAWAANSLAGNVANIDATTGLINNTAAFSSTANAATTGTAVTVYAGETAILPAETLSSGALSNYNTVVSCNAGTLTGTNGQSAGNTLAINAAATTTNPITCTYTNTRKTATLILRKAWANAKLNDAATITATGLTSFSSIANTANETDTATAQTVYAGDSLTLGETFSVGNANNYNSSLACSGNATALNGNSLTISPADTAITCGYTNARKSATLTLSKIWSAGSIAGNTVTVTSTGFANNATSGTSTATAAGNTTTGTAVTVYAGETGSITEAFGTGSAANYNAALDCSGNATALSSNSLTINPADTAINCAYTNAPKGTDLVITKTGTTSVKAGQPISYSIKVWNKGPVAVTNAVMTDDVPANISGVYIRCVPTGTATCGTVTPYTSGSNTRTATGISLPVDSAGNTNYVTYTVSGLAYQTGSFTNTATISSATITEINSGDNSASQATTITTDAAVTTGNAANQCLASQASNIITALPFTAYDSDNATQTANLTISNTGTGYGIGTNGAIVVNGKINWSYGNPRITGATLTIYINGTAYAVLTTVGASSNPSQATWTALNGASITPATVALGSYGDGTNAVPFSLTLPTSITSVTAGYIEFKNISPAGAGSLPGDDIGIAVDSILQCQKPIIKIAKLSTGGVGTFGFSGLTNLSSANGSAVTTDTVTTTTAGTAVTSAQTNYAIANATDINITENTVANYGLTAASCTDANSAVTGNTGSFGSLSGNSLTIPAASIKYGANITCTFNNAKQRNLTLRKIWVNARLNDAATITATGLTSFNSVAGAAAETDTATAQLVNVGTAITLGETISVGTGNYNAVLSCIRTSDSVAVAITGSNLTMPDADVTCGYTNSRIAQQLSLSKTWQNAVSGHTATATTTGGTNNPTFSSTSTGNNTTAGTAVTVYAGDVVTLPAETLAGGASAAQYNSTLACSGGSTLAGGAVNRSITISNNTTATVCTYTNARKSATLTLFKTWSAGSIAGNTVTVTSTGFANNATSGTSTATAAGNTTTGTAVTVYAGETGSITEAFGTGSAANYNAALTCSGNTNALSGNSLTINPADTAITCGYTNSVLGTDLAIEKTGSSSVTQGSTVSYSIKVWNKGPVVANSSTFADNVPTTLSNVSWNCVASGTANCGSTTSGTGNNISVTTGSLPINNTSTAPTTGSYLTFNVTGTANTTGTINNNATIAVTSGNDAVTTNNSSQASTTVTAPAAITPDPAVKEARFTIVPDLPTIYRGQSGNQLITINNLGPDAATGTVANFKLRPQNGVTVTSVKVVGGASCSLSAGEWSCPVGSVSNGANFQLQVSYDTTSSATLGTAIQADIRVSSNEFNPGSGVGETLYKVWGSNQTEEIRPNGAFWAGYLGPQGSVPSSGYNDETTAIINAWPISQLSPTGSYLVTAAPGSNNNIYAASSTNASPMINRIITNMSTDPARSVTLPSLDANSSGDNRRAWEFRTGVFVPQATNVTFCVGNTSVGIDDGAYIVLDGTVIGTQDSYAPGGYVSATVNFTPGYHTLSYRILNQNTYNGSAEIAQGLYGAIGILYNGSCNVAGFDAWVNTQVPASINIVEKSVVSITGRVFEDNSGTTSINSNAYNGTQDASEVGIAGSQVSLTNCSSTTVATTQTTANGDYQFSVATTDVPAGNFCIAQTNLTGYSSVSGSTGYTRATDIITVANTGATSYSGRNFGDARLSLLLTEDGQQTITAGGAADYPHRLTAQSVMNITAINQTATQQPASSTDTSWQTVLYRDTNCNGQVDSGESRVSATLPITLKPAEQICLVQRVYAPTNASMGAQHNAQLQANFSVTLADNSQITGTSVLRQDTTLLGSAGLSMQKGVRTVASCPSTASDTSSFVTQNQAQSGNYLEYEITYRNNSSKNLVNVSIKDSIPSGTVYQSIVCSVNPGVTCTPSHTNGTLLWQTNGTLSPNQQGKVRFCVQVP